MWGGITSISSECLLEDFVNRLWLDHYYCELFNQNYVRNHQKKIEKERKGWMKGEKREMEGLGGEREIEGWRGEKLKVWEIMG